ncbi:MAG: ribosome silencing factor [Methylotenera sp.]|uniref:ribosome silencing factor n=1 Tax=Methylotenera sp. TaxID=2051956 RepID=UPI002725B14E|nr:ribosome silencing factor [Methylotenera sp.]MDO9206203.1 ribosome silencing factor [Methylotenera sp.]MDO9394274.1 ribosome silencing factor [Methylotenera sp.]MDP1523749.1 ribosome silencing factor [Methylotenera sp.]MDP2230226.1 ribosome silencing factor [Methylotenera sp.]MDP3140196.1 ribosome silencing factor [Methylotenera sp.]
MTLDVNAVNYLETMKQAVVDAIEDIKGFDITVMDVRKLTSMTSYMIVASANSSRQAKAVADNVREKLKEKGYQIRGTEGEKEGEWVLVDLDDIVVHIMVPTTRAYYNLEQLWGEAESRRGHIKSDSGEAESRRGHIKAE